MKIVDQRAEFGRNVGSDQADNFSLARQSGAAANPSGNAGGQQSAKFHSQAEVPSFQHAHDVTGMKCVSTAGAIQTIDSKRRLMLHRLSLAIPRPTAVQAVSDERLTWRQLRQCSKHLSHPFLPS